MKIIDIGTVLSNKDPQGIGRIRYFSFDDNISSKQKLYNGPEWDKKDPLVASPFLPTHLSIIPEEKQSVKIIKHIAESDGIVNQEYIPGPFTTSHDFKNQVFKTQLSNKKILENVISFFPYIYTEFKDCILVFNTYNLTLCQKEFILYPVR